GRHPGEPEVRRQRPDPRDRPGPRDRAGPDDGVDEPRVAGQDGR
ncbi:MAG: Phosphoribosyl-AMP cyclohydrolase, partial [uncultured Phycisphaerae bacterium]